MTVVTINRLVINWMKEAVWLIGMDFVPGRVWSGVRHEASVMLRDGVPPHEVKRLCFTRLYKFRNRRAYSAELNRRNWSWRVAPQH